MSLIIEEMEMPKDGVYQCEISVSDGLAFLNICEKHWKGFLLMPLQPHGRLIDADELKRKIPKSTMIGTDDIEWIIDNGVNTIVEAEEEE